MYSAIIEERFDKEGVKYGDIIEVSWKGRKLIGELMPSSEANSENVIIIKLKNGYNIGLAYSDIAEIKKIGSAGNASAINKENSSTENKNIDLPNVEIIFTGGTIGSKVDYKTGGVYMLMKPEELLYYIPELGDIASISIKPLFSIASEDMSYIEWQEIAEEVAKAKNNGVKGVVITMGTDTMHYASAALSFMLHGINMPIAITGAQRSSDRGSSDAFMNLISAVNIAAKSEINGVGIVMHATSSDEKCNFIAGTNARKMHTSRRDAFRSINRKPIAEIMVDGHINYISEFESVKKTEEDVFKPMIGFEKKVALVKVYPNSEPDIIDYYVNKGYKGIIIEGTGLGHAPVSTKHEELLWLPHIKKAVDNGVIVGMASQCIYGRVNSNVYRNLRLISNAGAVYCEDMTPETAYVKLAWLLGNYSREEALKLLNRNIAGEISMRSEFDTFLI
ncbi:MAG: Glu-tRNA(Gln) amidotransferase subunit GatD [Candidatus Micrarchaeia archaeon]